ncbi:MAG: hypothetical protein ABEI58_00745 [Candidatus Nanohaloarchaea archaeon]
MASRAGPNAGERNRGSLLVRGLSELVNDLEYDKVVEIYSGDPMLEGRVDARYEALDDDGLMPQSRWYNGSDNAEAWKQLNSALDGENNLVVAMDLGGRYDRVPTYSETTEEEMQWNWWDNIGKLDAEVLVDREMLMGPVAPNDVEPVKDDYNGTYYLVS